ncbi:MAG: VCBS repeat-containing protein [Acidobacteria bacterium]|nr:VCBS repeat-containing protein [Acidobacteriota bacterium]
MPLRLLLPVLATTLLFGAEIERRGAAPWPNANHFRLRHDATSAGPAAAGFPLPAAFNPDSVRVMAPGGQPLAAKTEIRAGEVRVAFSATAAGAHWVYFDEGRLGETERAPEPAMIGSGDRVSFGRPGVRGRVSVGLWPHPAALDMDGDGDLDLVIGCADRPSNGTYLFENIGSNAQPLYARGLWMGPGHRALAAADYNGDGAMDIVVNGGYYSDAPRNRMARFVPIKLERTYHVGRDDHWMPADWDGDGRMDLLVGTSDWRDYGWDDAYDATGRWTRGPLHGFVYLHRNLGTNAEPRYEAPVKIAAGGQPIDLYGSPAPTPVDWFGRGVLDLVGGSFVDTVTLFRNTGTRTAPALASGSLIRAGDGRVLHMDLCMIQPRVVYWHPDGRPSLLIAEEDGRVALVENTAPRPAEPRLAAPRYLEQVDPFVKSGVLSRPVAVDWNVDGLLDIVAGNSAGYIQFFQNTSRPGTPAFEDRGYLKAGGAVIRRIAGKNGSVQGPAEEKWGYANISVADWDLDGKLDILLNDIWGDVVWFRNTGTAQAPELAAAQSVEVEWEGAPPKPDWVWWQPKPKQLLTQWRTTPKVVDWDRDGLPDLVMLNHQGYLSLFRRRRTPGGLRLGPPERIFLNAANGRFLLLANGRAGASGRRKIELADWDGDGTLDLITDSDDGPVWYRNTGTIEQPRMQPRGTLVNARLPGHNPTPNVADWNGDGRLDLLIGAEDGFLYFYDRRFIDAQR